MRSEANPAHRRFQIAVGAFRGEAILQGEKYPSFEVQLPPTIPTNFSNVLIQMQPSNG